MNMQRNGWVRLPAGVTGELWRGLWAFRQRMAQASIGSFADGGWLRLGVRSVDVGRLEDVLERWRWHLREGAGVPVGAREARLSVEGGNPEDRAALANAVLDMVAETSEEECWWECTVAPRPWSAAGGAGAVECEEWLGRSVATDAWARAPAGAAREFGEGGVYWPMKGCAAGCEKRDGTFWAMLSGAEIWAGEMEGRRVWAWCDEGQWWMAAVGDGAPTVREQLEADELGAVGPGTPGNRGDMQVALSAVGRTLVAAGGPEAVAALVRRYGLWGAPSRLDAGDARENVFIGSVMG